MTDFIPFAPPDAEPFYPATKAEAATAARQPSDAPAEAQGASAPGARRERKNYSAEAAIKAGDFRFRRFLAERHGLEPPLTEERATQRLRSVLGVTSRKELNVPGSIAAERWNRLRRDFDGWLKATEPPNREWRGSTSDDSRRRV